MCTSLFPWFFLAISVLLAAISLMHNLPIYNGECLLANLSTTSACLPSVFFWFLFQSFFAECSKCHDRSWDGSRMQCRCWRCPLLLSRAHNNCILLDAHLDLLPIPAFYIGLNKDFPSSVCCWTLIDLAGIRWYSREHKEQKKQDTQRRLWGDNNNNNDNSLSLMLYTCTP